MPDCFPKTRIFLRNFVHLGANETTCDEAKKLERRVCVEGKWQDLREVARNRGAGETAPMDMGFCIPIPPVVC